MVATTIRLTCLRHELDLAPAAFGELRDSNGLLDDPVALRERMRDDGYIFLRDYLHRDEVLEAREEICRRLDAEGYLDRRYPLVDAVTAPGKKHSFSDKYGNDNPEVDLLVKLATDIFFDSEKGFETYRGGPFVGIASKPIMLAPQKICSFR